MFCPFYARHIPIFIDTNCAFIVFVEDRVTGAAAPQQQQIFGPENDGHEFVRGSAFCIGGNPNIQLLFGRCIYGHAIET